MAVKDFFDNLNGGARWDVGVSINRSNSLPLDANSVFDSLEAAQNYAAGTPAEGVLANAYPGQVLAVVTDAETIIYYIDANMALQPVGNTKDVMAYIGDIPDGSDATTIIEYINAKTAGIATDTALAELQTAVNNKVDKVEGKDLSTNDLTDELKANYDAAYTHSQADHAPVDAQANIIEKIKVNGTEQNISDKAVDITIPTKVSDLVNDSEYLTAVPDEYITETELNAKGYQTASDVEGIVDSAIAEINHAVFQKVSAVPDAAEAESNILYLVPSGDKMDIYAKIGEEMVLIDDTDADLSGYAKTEDLHEHANKTLLDTYDQSNDDIKDAIAKKHSHSFTDEDVNDAIAKEHEHTNFELLETYTQTEADLADVVAKKHEHSNVTVLESITADKVSSWDIAEKNVIASVDEAQFGIDGDRKLTLLDIAQSKISGLTNAAGGSITLVDALANKVDKKGTDRLITEEEAAKLELLVIDEETGQAAISGTVNANQVQGLSDLLNAKVDKVEGMGLSANNFTDTLLEKLNGIEVGAQVNVIEGIKFNGTAVAVGEDKIADITYVLPIADADTLGGVKSSDVENKITIAEDGTMEVNSVNINKLVQTGTLILNGGSSAE